VSTQFFHTSQESVSTILYAMWEREWFICSYWRRAMRYHQEVVRFCIYTRRC
jgi:hypothetical protein